MAEHLYIHWPFCKKKCSYCDFISFPKHEEFILEYHQALLNEVTHYAKSLSAGTEGSTPLPPIKSIFFGGGTPSLYPIPLLTELFETLHKHFSFDEQIETTIEINPGDVVPHRDIVPHRDTVPNRVIASNKLAAWKDLGINRLSIGVQILDEEILKQVNRHQTNQEVFNLLKAAPNYFNNISVDLILGLPGTTTEIWFHTLETLLNLGVLKHLSIYFLTIYDKTPLYFQVKQGKISLPSEEWLIKTYQKTIACLQTRSFLQYEISNFAQTGHESTSSYESIHNKAYWDRRAYKGFGLSAASFFPKEKKRLVNSNNLVEYIGYWKSPYSHKSGTSTGGCTPKTPYLTEEILSDREIFLEELMLGLRQASGVGLQRMLYFLKMFSPVEPEVPMKAQSPIRTFEAKVKQLKKQGFLKVENGRIFLTIRGIILENKVIADLAECMD